MKPPRLIAAGDNIESRPSRARELKLAGLLAEVIGELVAPLAGA